MVKIDICIYTCHRNIVSSNNNKNIRAHHTVYTLISDNINLENYYTNKYVKLVLNIFIKLSSNNPR